MPSHNTYHLTWVSLTLDVGYLFRAAPAKRSHRSLPWMRLPLLTCTRSLALLVAARASARCVAATVLLVRSRVPYHLQDFVWPSLLYLASFNTVKRVPSMKRFQALQYVCPVNLWLFVCFSVTCFVMDPTKVCLVKAMVFPVVMYGCESWTLKKAEHRRIVALNCGVGEDS